MGRHAVILCLASGLAGCSLIYNPSNISHAADAAPDSPPDASIDANANNLTLSDAFPTNIDEGVGDGMGRQQILVIHGSNFVSGATVSLSPTAMIDVDNANLKISKGSDYIAVPLTVKVDSTLAEGTPVMLTITVAQPAGGMMVSQQLANAITLHGHDTLTMANLPSDGASLKPHYSDVMIANASALTFTAGAASSVKIRAFGAIKIGDIDGRGGAAAKTTPGTAGPGGNPGGASVADGVGPSPGLHGSSSTSLSNGGGGGGAGFGKVGDPGTGAGNGGGGQPTGDDLLAGPKNAASGGGGGGAGGVIGLSPGGAGGGGGGYIELTAGGDVTCGKIDVTGGAGDVSGSGGGGGAGGAIEIRSGHAIAAGALTADGGAGGSGGSGGGKGSVGRIRWDSPMTAAPTGAVLGPSFVATTPLVVSTQSFDLIGGPTYTFDVTITDSVSSRPDVQGTTFDSNGQASISPHLGKGWNRVCITMRPGTAGTAEADKCIDVAYLP